MAKIIGKQTTGGPIDDSLSPQAMAAIQQVSADEFLSAAIGRLVGRFRLNVEYRDTRPTKTETITHLEQTERAITALLDKLELMPEDFKALASDDLFRISDESAEQMTERMTDDLQRYRALCRKVVHTMSEWSTKKGETPKALENKLLSDVADLLEPHCSGLENTAETAASILRAAGIKTMPVDKKKARAAILAYQRKSKTPR